MSNALTNLFSTYHTVLCADGYLFEAERRGYLTAGEFVPHLALDHPEVLLEITRDFLKSGSDISLAFTYNAHREKMRIIGKETDLEAQNRAAIQIAKKAAKEIKNRPILVAGNISNTNIFNPDDLKTHEIVRKMFREMCEWAADEGVDFIQGETFYYGQEAQIALEEIKRVGLPSAIGLAVFAEGTMRDMPIKEALLKIKDGGADVLGLNCFRGPETLLPLMKDVLSYLDPKENLLMALPIAYRTVHAHPTFFNLPDEGNTVSLPNHRTFPDALEAQLINRYQAADFAIKAKDMGFRYLGLCCGNQPNLMRAVTEAVGRKAESSPYSPNMEKHFMYGTDPSLKKHMTSYKNKA